MPKPVDCGVTTVWEDEGLLYYIPYRPIVVDGIWYSGQTSGAANRTSGPLSPAAIYGGFFKLKHDSIGTAPYRWGPGVPHLAERGILRG